MQGATNQHSFDSAVSKINRCISLLPLTLAVFGCHPASSQVALKANEPTGNASSSYNFQVLPGSQRQISVSLTGSKTNRVNWSILKTTGGATAALDRGANAIGIVNVTIGSKAGDCSISGSIGSYRVTSPATITIGAQAVDDPGQKVSFLFNVCAETTTAAVTPAYQQAYKGQSVELQSYVIGNTNEAGTWQIVTSPHGGDGKLLDDNKRDTVFHATVTGRYTLKFISAADASRTATGIVYVSPNPVPSYGLATANKTMSTECFVDPALKGKKIDVGPSQKIKSLADINLSSLPSGSIVRIHNDDTTGNAASVFHQILLINGKKTGGTPEQPKIICGVPDAKGHLPIVDAANATGGTQPYGAISLWGDGVYNSPFKDGSLGPDYVIISGLEVQNADQKHTYEDVTTKRRTPFNPFASCLNIRSGTYLMLAGNELHDCGNGIFIANNSNGKGYSQVTRFVTIRGNYLHDNGISGDTGKHHIYTGAWYTTIEGNRFDRLNGSGGGTAIKDRGLEVIHRYNFFNTPNAGYEVAINSVQDSQPYVVFEPLLGQAGTKQCTQSVYCDYEHTINANQVAAFQEGLQKTFLYGNIYVSRALFLADIQTSDSGGDQGYAWQNQTEMADHLGTTYFYNNTVDNPGLAVFATLSGTNNGGEPTQQPLKPTLFAANNIFYKAKTGTTNIFAFARNASIIGRWQTNLMNKGTFNITKPIMGKPSTNTTPVYGWQNYTDKYQYPGDIPIDDHQSGLTAGNFLSTPVQNHEPYNPATYAPTSDGGAIGRGLKITEPIAAQLPVRWQYEVTTGQLKPRTTQTTIGAVDAAEQPSLLSIAPTSEALRFFTNHDLSTPCNFGGLEECLPQIHQRIYTPVAIPLACTWSNGIVNDCGPNATFSSPELTFYDNNAFIPKPERVANGSITVRYRDKTAIIPIRINRQ